MKKAINPLYKTAAILFLILFLTVSPKPVSANLFEDFLNEMNSKLKDGVEGVKDLVAPKKENKALTLESEIKLAVDGDINKNGQIDAGDSVNFIYIVQNTTDKKYAYATLKTNIRRSSINYIRNVSGVTGLKDDGKTIEFPNLRIEPGMVKEISFEANVNYFTETDPTISTEPELVSEDKQSLLKSLKKEIQVKRIKKEDIPDRCGLYY